MGDPGVAKSQLLSYVDRLAPRSMLQFVIYRSYIVIHNCFLINTLSCRSIDFWAWILRSRSDCFHHEGPRDWTNDVRSWSTHVGWSGYVLMPFFKYFKSTAVMWEISIQYNMFFVCIILNSKVFAALTNLTKWTSQTGQLFMKLWSNKQFLSLKPEFWQRSMHGMT